MNRISKILIVAVIVASSAGAANAQAFSSAYGTGNVQPSHYDNSGKLVLDNVQQNPVARIDRTNDGLSSFASVPAGNERAIAVPGELWSYNEMLLRY